MLISTSRLSFVSAIESSAARRWRGSCCAVLLSRLQEYVHRRSVREAGSCSVSQSRKIISALVELPAAVTSVVFMTCVTTGGKKHTFALPQSPAQPLFVRDGRDAVSRGICATHSAVRCQLLALATLPWLSPSVLRNKACVV